MGQEQIESNEDLDIQLIKLQQEVELQKIWAYRYIFEKDEQYENCIGLIELLNEEIIAVIRKMKEQQQRQILQQANDFVTGTIIDPNSLR